MYDRQVRKELEENILPFWMKHTPDHKNGGFYGRLTNELRLEERAPKGLILVSRILWAFAAAYRFKRETAYLEMADRAFQQLNEVFRDPVYGGYYWMVSYQGQPVDVKKKLYGHAFTIYALAEYALATGEEAAGDLAKEVFFLVEEKSRDNRYQGYFETYNRDWTLASDLRLSEKDMDEKKSMNTHLHLLEAYTNLYRIWKGEPLKQALNALLAVFMEHIIDPETNCFRLFFDEKWQPKTGRVSFGHDIEGSWLLFETASLLEDDSLIVRVSELSVRMAETVLARAVDNDGAIVYEGSPQGAVDEDRHWWTQAEAAVGFLNAFQLSGDERFFEASFRTWEFITQYIVDKEHGEWYWKVDKQGVPDPGEYKVSEWKTPYHNARACMELAERLNALNDIQGKQPQSN
jgi:mannobiose 2-epimerase